MLSPMRVRIIVLATYPVVRAGLRSLLEKQEGLQVIAESGSAADAIAIAQREEADVVLLDPDTDEVSLHAVAAVAEGCRCRILVFSAATAPGVYARAIELGAAGVVSKDQTPELLARAVRKVHAGELWLDRAKTASVLSQVTRRRQDPEVLKIESLTRRERELIALLGEGLKNSAVAERLFISEATVRNHLTSILSKLGLANRFELAIFAFRHHLIPESDNRGTGRPRINGVEEPRHQAAERRWAPVRREPTPD